MKTKSRQITVALVLLALSTLNVQLSTAHAQGTAFTYQGRLNEGTNHANGNYDFRFSVQDAITGGSQIAGPITNGVTDVSNGLFTVTLDFGDGVFTGADRWLEIGVRTNGAADFSPLAPRQKITAAPYAITAGNVTSVEGTYGNAVTFSNAANMFNGIFEGDGGALINVNAATLGGISPSNFWQLGGNAGTTPGTQFLGTTDNQPLEIKVNGVRALRIEPNTNGAPNIIAGSPDNTVAPDAIGAAIGGGKGSYISTNADFTTISGGGTNLIGPGAFAATIGGGQFNGIGRDSAAATIAGGFLNVILKSALHGSISGGYGNIIGSNAWNTTIGGGDLNAVDSDADSATITGGEKNYIHTDADFATIGGGSTNLIGPGAFAATIAGGQLNGIGSDSATATIAGGFGNFILINALNGSIGGGYENVISSNAWNATIGGGDLNAVDTEADSPTIGGGEANYIYEDADYGTIAGGRTNQIFSSAAGAAIGGGELNGIGHDSPTATIAGGYLNFILPYAENGTIGGGENNSIGSNTLNATISGGRVNVVDSDADSTTIGGGEANYIHSDADFATIGGGDTNLIGSGAAAATIGGGNLNVIGADSAGSTIAGGYINLILTNAANATIGGGNLNVIGTNAYCATIPGGQANVATGDYSFAAGRRANASLDGSFVWADGNNFSYNSPIANSFSARATGGFYLATAINGSGTPTSLVYLSSGATSWASVSDRAAKKNFSSANDQDVLEKLTRVPVSSWNYKWESDSATPNIGPMAQDFKQAFYPGRDDKSITTLEFDGVELAAIQGLNQKVESENAALRVENAELKSRLDKLEQLINNQNGGAK